MGCILSCLACQAASCVCSGYVILFLDELMVIDSLCTCCGKAVGRAVGGKIAYVVLFLFVSLIAWIFSGWGVSIFQQFWGTQEK
jgi:hypothetical protein